MQAVLASSSPDALLNSLHPSTLQDCAGRIGSRLLLRFLALLLRTTAGNSKRNYSLLCSGTSSVGRREENKPEAPRNSINKQRFIFNVVLKRARDLGSRRRREDCSLSIGERFSQTQNKNEPAPLLHITPSRHPAWTAGAVILRERSLAKCTKHACLMVCLTRGH